MWSYGIENIITKKREVIFGYNVNDAFRRAKDLDPSEWVVVDSTYED